MAPHIIAQYGQYSGERPSPVFMLVYLAFLILMVASWWKMFTKAGQPGWASIVPILNLYFLCKVARMSGWWVVGLLIPIVNFFVLIPVSINVAKRFGKGAGFGIGLWLLPFIFYPILAFGDSRAQPA